MALKDTFTTTEWQTLEYAPLWVLTAVGSVDGKINEKAVEAFTKELADAPFYKNELVRELMLSVLTNFADVMKRYAADARKIDKGLTDAADVLDKKAPTHAEDFKKVMLAIAAKVASAVGLTENTKMAFMVVAISLRAKLEA
jgi:hypothetical protein